MVYIDLEARPLFNDLIQTNVKWEIVFGFGFIGGTLLRKDDSLFIGDMNNNVRWDHKTKKEWQWATYVEKLRKLDKHSVWHKTKGEEHGLESVSTLFWYRQPERGYHIDYVFGSESLIEKAKIEIGAHQDWLMHSDHVPLVLDIED